MRKIKLGFIGCGICARDLHWPALKQLDDRFQVVNVCSRTEEKARRFAELTGSERYVTSVDDLLNDKEVEAVVINYPFEMNYELTQKALAAGKHVFVEKPMAKNLKEAEAMVKLEEETPLATMIAEGFRYRRSVITVRDMVKSGKIGRPAAMMVRLYDHFARDAKWLTESSWRLNCVGGVMMDRDVHWFAAMREIFGDVESAIGYQKLLRNDIGPVDQVTLSMVFRNGAIGHFIDVASLTGLSGSPFEIIGSEGTIKMEGFKTIELTNVSGDHEVIEFPEGDGGGYVEEFIDFHESILAGKKPKSSFAEGKKDLEMGLLTLDSNEKWNDLRI
ncbi:MAG: Gfo/Idh/MocA family oxidoreductase [Clostridia bacterium]|nr:Gfo/Idh/MocA family oxidoreductase [Clostridia bacterium]MBQ5957413.1 Gfo/Idh/MocA family oxidoreductase [Clostridia bacterium]